MITLWTSVVRVIGAAGLCVLCACAESTASTDQAAPRAFASSVYRMSQPQKRVTEEDDLLRVLKSNDTLGLPAATKTAASILMDYATGEKTHDGGFCLVNKTSVQLPKAQTGYFIISVPLDFLVSSKKIFTKTADRLAVIDDDIDPMAAKQERTNFFSVENGFECENTGMFARTESTVVGTTEEDFERTVQADLARFENGRLMGWYSLLVREDEEVSLEVEVPEYDENDQLRELKSWLVECHPGYSCEIQHHVSSAL